MTKARNTGIRSPSCLSPFYVSHSGLLCKLLFEEESCWLRKGKRLAPCHTAEAGEGRAKKRDQRCEVRGQLGAPRWEVEAVSAGRRVSIRSWSFVPEK